MFVQRLFLHLSAGNESSLCAHWESDLKGGASERPGSVSYLHKYDVQMKPSVLIHFKWT